MSETARTVRVRFAPSPTGYLHIGGVRTAMFNWLYARHHGGTYVLRVDDTDQQRNIAEALQPILDGFRWLDLGWDEGVEVGGPHAPYFQSQRLARYQAAAARLIERGHAYRDYATPEEIAAERGAAEAGGGRYHASRRWAAESAEDRRRFEAEGRSFVVRLKMPRAGQCVIDDQVRGRVVSDWASEADHVIQRADGTCLYHLASVVDDVDMEITHIIRAEEHLSNTPRQIFIFQGLGAPLPAFAHLPVVAEPGSRVKLSKRKLDKYLKNAEFAGLYERGKRIAERLGHTVAAETFNPVIVEFYRVAGFEPEAILNYLMLLGWSLDDKTEILSRDERIASFSLAGVNKSAASFDPAKLLSFQERYMMALSVDQRAARCLAYVEQAGWVSAPAGDAERAKVRAIVAAASERIKIAGDVLDYDEFFVADDRLVYDDKAFEKRLRKPPRAAELLRALAGELAAASDFSAAALEPLLHGFVEARGLGLGDIVHAVRVAVTGKAVGFGLFDILAILGRDRVLARIDRALERLAAG
jgi:glutamyl-tRNA synthetase